MDGTMTEWVLSVWCCLCGLDYYVECDFGIHILHAMIQSRCVERVDETGICMDI